MYMEHSRWALFNPIFLTLLPCAGKTNGSKCKESGVALKLGLRKPPDISVDEYYPTFLNMAKNFMEGIYRISPSLH